VRLRLFSLLATLVVLAGACVSPPPEARSPSDLDAAQMLPCAHVVRIAFLQDKSNSAAANGVYQLRADELRPLADLIIRCGGEMAVGLVGDDSGLPLERWFVPRPAALPSPPSDRDTAINAAIARSEYESRRTEYERRNHVRVEAAERELRPFLDRVRALLGRDPTNARTPLWRAIARADGFLGEPDTVSGGPSSRHLVLSSDGVNTVGSPISLMSGATLYICNGPSAVGSLAGLPAIVVESPVGAFRKIIDAETPHAD
jgi:hypothetical protein